MSDEKEKPAEAENPFADPMKMFSEIYNRTLKETSEQWEETARNPMFLAAMANNVEQSLQMQKQMQEMIATSLAALNLPTKDDIMRLAEKIDELGSNIAAVNSKLDRLAKIKQNKNKGTKLRAKIGKTKS
jgi:polyhydroxyalkanoate synthesis regulator phasin